ncbi:MAG TPA: lipoyl synthase [Candidatus Desulfofervidus auxilii]|uniref:Lipoyl synthase n=1 Tax=Desulfofervidus auxilii TaxID=1621989 RepID=A0A7V0NEG8_DESA2|nr:lipoyl synthase [Candidatus Desulfofervidus auxilii]
MELKKMKKPIWLHKKVNLKVCYALKSLLRDLKLYTICEEAHCPNISECFSQRIATFLILGDICTRNCAFCNVKTGKTKPIDPEEPKRIAEAVYRLNLKHVVITSVTRDDLADGGASHFVQTIFSIREKNKKVTIEVLIPDFKGKEEAIKMITTAKPDIIGHNIETVPRLYPIVRKGADFSRSLKVLRLIKQLDSNIYTKSGIMLGLGEKKEEVIEVFKKLRKVGCDFLSIGQYLPPSLKAYPVKEYIHPNNFDYYKKKALALGFLYVMSGPYVRSSYLAKEFLSH